MSKEAPSAVEWRINVPPGATSKILVPGSSGLVSKIKGLLGGLIFTVWRFLAKAWSLGKAEPDKVVHGLKVGLTISIVSLLNYVRPLYDSFGHNAIWAVMTVVVVFESKIGAMLCKCTNRVTGTFVAGAVGLGIQWLAVHAGQKAKPVILAISVFLFASVATFSRFIPSVKTRFDYGATVFVLTYSLVSVSGYRVDKMLFDLAWQRLTTIAMGVSLCIFVSMLICPNWAGNELHCLIYGNMKKLADSLDGCVAEYFKENGEIKEDDEDHSKKIQGYKCVLNSKASEESLANFAGWEPAHGSFSFGYPWKQYLKIGASVRNCAYCLETLSACLSSEIQAPTCIKSHLSDVSMRLCSYSAHVLTELATMIKTMTKSSTLDLLVAEMNFAIQELQDALKSHTNPYMAPELLTAEGPGDASGELVTKSGTPLLLEIIPLATTVSLLIEIAARIGGVVDAVEELTCLTEFKPAQIA
ncbi:hypothetical protein SLA2020_512690 [Shorea laevis]